MNDQITNLESARFILTLKNLGDERQNPFQATSAIPIIPRQQLLAIFTNNER